MFKTLTAKGITEWLEAKAKAEGASSRVKRLFISWHFACMDLKNGARYTLLHGYVPGIGKRGAPSLWGVASTVVKIETRHHIINIPGFKTILKAINSTQRKVNRWTWALRESKFNFWLHTKAKPWVATLGGNLRTVNAYTSDMCYGGPEEGGWWYDAYQCIDSRKCWVWNADKVKAEFLKEHGPAHETGYDYSSVLGGHEVRVCVENFKAESETRERPHYE